MLCHAVGASLAPLHWKCPINFAEVNRLIGLREAMKGYGFVVWMDQRLYYQKYGKPHTILDV